MKSDLKLINFLILMSVSFFIQFITSSCSSSTLPTSAETPKSQNQKPSKQNIETEKENPVVTRLVNDVEHLAGKIVTRNLRSKQKYKETLEFIRKRWEHLGYKVKSESVPTPVNKHGTGSNLYIEIKGSKKDAKWFIVGAHFDTAHGTPGADDNASGVAGLLELSRRLAKTKPENHIRLIAFTNEEPPYFHKADMGSLVHAKNAKARNEKIIGMISLECIGYFSDAPNSQKIPEILEGKFPAIGNYIAFIGNVGSTQFINQSKAALTDKPPIPVEVLAGFELLNVVGFSDHWSFWKIKVPAFMVTDTAMFRNPHYHKSSDTPDTLDYPRMAKVVDAVEMIIKKFAEIK